MDRLKVIKKLINNKDIVWSAGLPGGERLQISVEPNKAGERFIVDVSVTYGDLKDKNFLGNLWHKHGMIDHPIESYINISTELTNGDGSKNVCNPTRLKNGEINFQTIMPATNENVIELIEMTIAEYRKGA